MVGTVALALAGAVLLGLALLTGAGQKRRGGSAPVVWASGACFPVTWLVWYFRDERPFARSARRSMAVRG